MVTLVIILLLQLSMNHPAYETASVFMNDNRTIREIILELESETGYRFLYRDALVAGIESDFQFNDSWVTDFIELLNRIDLDAKVDTTRKQVVIFRKTEQTVNQPVTGLLKGYVIDDNSGERLPFATVIWKAGESTASGTQTDLRGSFRIPVERDNDVNLRFSHIGYENRHLILSSDELPHLKELPVRLQPASVEAAEIVITCSAITGVADTVYNNILNIGSFNPLGESNTIRMLQTLPSVGFGPALSEGAFIRGSNPDALQVMLDGSVIYNQSHLFGLVDSFNADAIRTSSFHYDITPASYQAPPGGTLSLITKTGSLYEYGGNIGLSNSVIRGSLEGPVKEGRSSFLLSGRGSILNLIDWFHTGDMVAWGLNIDRENSLDESLQIPGERIVTPGIYGVNFHDLHGKLFLEGNDNNRWMLSLYSGFNRTFQHAERIVRINPDRQLHRLESRNFETRNRWGNNAINLSTFQQWSDELLLEVRSGISYYHTRYLKEDFVYQRPQQLEQLLYVHEFENESELTHWYFSVDFDYLENFEFGAALHGYRSAYLENSLNRPQFFQRTTPLLAEFYGSLQLQAGNTFDVTAGGRLQYFSDNSYLKFSPRVRTTLLPDSPVSMGFGYSRNYQYLHKLSFYNLTTSDIWITATGDQPPSTVDQLTSGIYIRPWKHALLQVEGYYKWQQDLRFHEINIQSVNNPFEAAPWYFDNDGKTRGIEFLFRQSIRSVTFTQTYSTKKTELKNSRLNNGDWYFAQWDRRHQFNTLVSLQAFQSLNLHLNWTYATGVPDRLDLFTSSDERLGDYSRIDLSMEYEMVVNDRKLKIQAGIFNLLNRNNPWYRDYVLTVQERLVRDRLIPVQADVYDMGFQPSFSVNYYF
jgi:hypothetical protein